MSGFQEVTDSIVREERPAKCDVHGDFVSTGISLSGKNLHWSGCKKCREIEKEEQEKERQIELRMEEQQKLESRLNKAGIPARFKDRTLDSFIADTPAKLNALSVARDFVDNFTENHKEGMTLVFSGKAGTGKSHLAIAIAKAVMPKYTAMYINALDAIRMIRDTWRKDAEQSELEILEMFGKFGLLVIDEVGVQYGTENEQMLMFDIINRRYRDSKPMILLTNLGTQGFSEYLTERSYDRLRENGKWVSFEWESYRAKVNK